MIKLLSAPAVIARVFDHFSEYCRITWSVVSVEGQPAYLEPLNGSDLFGQAEIELVNSYKSEKRRKEWIAGRTAAKHALAEYFPLLGAAPFEILPGRNGEPVITGCDTPFLSITHCGGYAVATACEFPIGIDLEQVENRPDALKSYFYSEAERLFIAGLSSNENQVETRIWTEKEAVSKLLKRGGKIPFKAIECLTKRAVVYGSETDIQLNSCVDECYSFSLAVHQKEVHHG